MNENKELIIQNSEYITNSTNDFNSELAGLDSGFDRIKIPTGGGLNFEIPNLENSDEPIFIKEFSAIILYHHPLFTYYENKYSGNNNPPDCCSLDGVTGSGNPGGKCSLCKLNMFGSGENGSKACKNKHKLYILRERELFPVVLVLPASSIQELSKYIRGLLSTGRKSDFVVTKLSLKKAMNKTGIAFSKVCFSTLRDLQQSEKDKLKDLIKQVKNYAVGNSESCQEEDEDL